MRNPFSAGIRARLLVIVLLAMLPLFALIGYDAASHRERALAEARSELGSLARLAAEDLEIRIEAAHHLLHALVEAPAVRAAAAPACAELFKGILSQARRYNNLLVVGADGELLCSGVAAGKPVNYADTDYVGRVLESGAPTIGKPTIGRLTGRAVLPVAVPIADARGRVEKVVAVGLLLDWFGEHYSRMVLLPGMVIVIWDEEGRVLYRHPDDEKWTGTLRTDTPLVEVARRTKSEGVVESAGFDGMRRVYALSNPAPLAKLGVTLAFGAPAAALAAEADRAMFRNFALLALLGLAGFALAWWIADVLVRRPVARLANVSRRLREGDLAARAAGPHPRGEIGTLTAEINEAAAALQARTEELRRSNRTLRTLSECNQALVRASDEPQLLQAICDRIVRFGGYRSAWVGYAEDDAAKSVRLAARAGDVPPDLAALLVTWADEPRGRGPTGSAIRTGEVFVANDIATDARVAPWRDVALAQGFASCIGLPLQVEDRCIGALTICAAECGAFSDEELPLLRELAADLAYGIAALRARRAREQAEERLHAAAASSLDAFYVLDSVRTGSGAIADFVFRYVNDPGGRLVSMPAEHLIGQRLCELLPINRTGGFFDRYVRVVETGEPLNEEFPIADAAIGAGWLHHQVVRAGDGIAITSRDITERKRAEEEIRALNESLERRVAERTRELEAASRAKSDFLANMSHELRTPLNAIIGFSEMLKDGVLGELEAKQRGFVGDIFDAGTHLLALIDDILDLSKVEAGMMRLEADAVDVRALLQASLLIVKEKAAAHRIRLAADLDPALGTVFADERKVKQIVYNLLANAVKFTPDGGAVTLSARLCPRDGVAPDAAMAGRLIPLPPGADAEFLQIAVEDTGAGIAEEHLGKLFDPFVQLDSSTTRRAGGTGLGLAMVRRLAELHGGTVGVASRPGTGSRFCVWLPYRVFAAEPPAAFAPTAPVRAAPAGRPLGLVIEDDDRAAGLIEAQLRSEGYDTMRAATAEEGLVRAAKRKPDLITLDIFLPEMDGWEFLRRLKAHPALCDVPVVIVTVAEDSERGLALGARRVLQKPFTREQLVETLAGLVAPRADGAAPCVLVVDDNAKAVDLVATALEAEGYRVLRAYGGAEAIEAARRALPDLVILDLMMPEVSGFEVAKTLREAESTARIPILVLTAKDLSAEDRARLNGAVSAILQKASFSRSELLAELRRALPKRID